MGKRKKRGAKKPFSPTKGGDGGVLPKVRVELGTDTTIARNANSRRAMTCVPRDDWGTLRTTSDPYDRSHSTRDGAMLIPAGVTVRGVERPTPGLNAKPRLYPECYMTGAGYSFETAEEKLAERRKRMEGWAPREIASQVSMSAHVKEALYRLERSMDAAPGSTHRERVRAAEAKRKLRKCISPGDDRTPEERANDALADQWAASRGVDLSARSGGGGGD